ncbi:dipeptidase [Gracilibacillus timonensis]|uniref:dipeptidase n=1 Tax=Gracilibacillus timonensis TaxID=1816696 RepID=UPI00082689C9|nr:membrane dipeptidase [Gracilibacillus timonensis]
MIDCHCDALYKMWLHQIDFEQDDRLDVNYQEWMQSPVQVQCFAIYIPPSVPAEATFTVAMQMIDIFFERIIAPYTNIIFIQKKEDIAQLAVNEKGAMLTLEGLDCIGAELYKLRTLLRLGVKMVGVSWNHANLVIDGIGEGRGAGLTNFGYEVIDLLNQYKIWTDLAHVSRRGFDQVIELAAFPIVSHANCYHICPHPRNLTDQQIQKLIKKNGLMGLTFVKEFVTNQPTATMQDLLLHMAHLLRLGGEQAVVFGSDFDGTDQYVTNLTSIKDYAELQRFLQGYFSPKQLTKMTEQNFLDLFPCS